VRLLGLDFETSGFDPKVDRIIEVGAVLWDSDKKAPLSIHSNLVGDADYPLLSDEIIQVTGITNDMLNEFGRSITDPLLLLDGICNRHKVSYIVAHNGQNFDRHFLLEELKRTGLDKICPTIMGLPWLDTLYDIPFEKAPDSRKLNHLALDHNFMNPFKHRAVFDALTCLMVLSNYSLEDVATYSKEPWIVVRALVSFDDRQLAKDKKYSWEKLGDGAYPKMWVKKIKENALEKEQTESKFKLAQIKERDKDGKEI